MRWTKTATSSAFLTGLGIVLFLAMWELAARSERFRSPLLPPPSAVALEFRHSWHDRTLVNDTLASVRRVSIGFLYGSTLGLVVGSLYLIWPVRALLAGVFGLIRPIPPLAWIGLALLWFGFGDPPAHFLVALGAFFPTLSGTYLGFARVEVSYLRAGQALGLPRHLLFTRVLLPQALPSILSSLRVGMGVAWMIVVTAELVGAQSGLGYAIQVNRAQLQVERVMIGMIVIGMIGASLNLAMILIERAALPWKKRGRELASE
jgi:ABC-type nitrate/sulfonate/bicarbonate transport system permease component